MRKRTAEDTVPRHENNPLPPTVLNLTEQSFCKNKIQTQSYSNVQSFGHVLSSLPFYKAIKYAKHTHTHTHTHTHSSRLSSGYCRETLCNEKSCHKLLLKMGHLKRFLFLCHPLAFLFSFVFCSACPFSSAYLSRSPIPVMHSPLERIQPQKKSRLSQPVLRILFFSPD